MMAGGILSIVLMDGLKRLFEEAATGHRELRSSYVSAYGILSPAIFFDCSRDEERFVHRQKPLGSQAAPGRFRPVQGL